MSDVFAAHEADFAHALAAITAAIAALPPPGNARTAAVRAAARAIDDADETVAQMGQALRALPAAASARPRVRLRGYGVQLDTARAALQTASLLGGGGGDRRALLAGGAPVYDAVTGQRQQLLASTQRMEQSSQRLLNAERMAQATADIGAGILSNLAQQRDVIVATHSTLADSEVHLDRSLKTLRGMARRYLSTFPTAMNG